MLARLPAHQQLTRVPQYCLRYCLRLSHGTVSLVHSKAQRHHCPAVSLPAVPKLLVDRAVRHSCDRCPDGNHLNIQSKSIAGKIMAAANRNNPTAHIKAKLTAKYMSCPTSIAARFTRSISVSFSGHTSLESKGLRHSIIVPTLSLWSAARRSGSRRADSLRSGPRLVRSCNAPRVP